MSGLLGSITGTIGRLFGNLLPSWGGPPPVPSELPEPSELPVPEEEPEADSEGDSKDVKFYDGSTHWIGSENDFRDLSRDWFLIKANLKETLQEVHKRYNEEANAIFWKSGGQIDLRATGTYASASLRFFQDVARGPRKAENLTPEEDYWIRSAYMGGLVWAEPYEGIATEMDYNEFYPEILASFSAGWPIGPGEFRTITYISVSPINYNLKYGIYHAFIGGQPADQKYIRAFCYNPTGYYTHYDLKLAIDLGLHIELSSESPNALVFEQNKLMSGRDIFKFFYRNKT
ncbi:hypothetical protein RclHR1_23510001 [Rhizophagus clarus]|uniref:DNA-directed DNA polymerase n=1 Tax=Rhizophagus clarus TaxID=94130 RepID=A0A2Z6RBV0_9GLOM|nr:hypothetical protein RclHR1_23510001 [Rhizophagus clarus]